MTVSGLSASDGSLRRGWDEPDPHFGRVALAQVNDHEFVLLKPLRYHDGGGAQPYTVPADTTWRTDLASVPFMLWAQIAPFGRQTRAAIVHDYGCKLARAKDRPRSREARTERVAVDRRFRNGLLHDDVPKLRAVLMWAGVSVQRIAVHSHPLVALTMVVQLILGVAWIYWFVVAAIVTGQPPLGGRWGWWLLAVPVLLALPWARASMAILLTQIFTTLVLPMAVLNLMLSIVLAGINALVSLRLPRASDIEPRALRGLEFRA